MLTCPDYDFNYDRSKNLRPKRNIRTAMNHEVMMYGGNRVLEPWSQRPCPTKRSLTTRSCLVQPSRRRSSSASTRRSRYTTLPLKPRLLPHTPVLVLTAPRLPLAGVQVSCVGACVKPTHRSLAPHPPVTLTTTICTHRHVALRCLAEYARHAAVRLRSRRTDSHSPHARSPHTDRANAARVRRQMLLYMARATVGPQTPPMPWATP